MYTRQNPFPSRLKERSLVTAPHSSKKTYHIVLDIAGADFPFKVGDSVGVCPTNDPQEVEEILKILRLDPRESVLDARANIFLSIQEFLLYKANLARVNTAFLKLLIEKGAPLSSLLEPDNKSQLTEFLHQTTMREILHHAPLSASDLARTAMPLLPRFYSIANSTKVFPNEIHLLVAYVHYHFNGQTRQGVGSHFLCDFAEIGATPIPIYLQPSHHFTLPTHPETPIILVGPGTGIAPYRAFLQERLALQSPGQNWIFFGERNRATDFYYADFWLALEEQGRITLDLAFSRDQSEKVYVQHKMYEKRKTLWNWLQQGAYFYLCGDAEKMAKDVDAMLHRIVQEEGLLSPEDARLYIKKMRAEKRYLTDVY